VIGCILRDFQFDAENYKSFIDAQDHLHKNVGRRRTLVSMGTHDYDTIKVIIIIIIEFLFMRE
jgi:phenylalanyl-tRNA synthetase beta chain